VSLAIFYVEWYLFLHCRRSFGRRGQQRFMCHECGRTYKQARSFIDHLQTHRPPAFECAFCGRLFSLKVGPYDKTPRLKHVSLLVSCLLHKAVIQNPRIKVTNFFPICHLYFVPCYCGKALSSIGMTSTNGKLA
jgi:hypothetical protein